VVTAGAFPNTYRVRWSVPANLRASLIICSRNAKLLKRCLEAVEKHTAHPHREFVIVQHRAGDIAAMDRLLEYLRLRARAIHGPFNFAAMNNLGARHATGDVLVFMNDDVEPLENPNG
jgi:O-antigen biosynthesis protein